MNKAAKRLLLILTVLLAASLACNMLAGGDPEPPMQAETLPEEVPTQPAEQESSEPEPTLPAEPESSEPQPTVPEPESKDQGGDGSYDTEFPLPDDVQNFMLNPGSDSGINFQTAMSLEEVVAFYRGEFTAQGLVERQLLTVVEESVFSMVFDGAPNGKAVVIQGVVLGPDQTNVNIRYEDV